MADLSALRARIATNAYLRNDIALSLDKVARGTFLDRLNRVRKRWIQFERDIPEIPPCGLESHPALSDIEYFFEWRALTSKNGRLISTGHVTTATLLTEFDSLRTILRARTGRDVSRNNAKQIENFIKHTLPKITKSRAATRKKSVGTVADAEEMNFFLWSCDEYEYAHPRLMNQLSFCLIIMAFYGLRPGEVIEAGNHKGTGEGLTYGDLDLSLHYFNGTPRYQLRVQLRYRKRYRGELRDQDNLLLYEETEVGRKAFCPIVHFLGLALADDVFDNLSLSDLENRQIPNTSNSRSFIIKEDKKELPILRMFTGPRKGQVTSASSLLHQMRKFGERCGYKDVISGYCLRRGFATGIDGQISSAKQRQLLGHASDKTGQAYISATVAVDTQHAIRGEAQDTDYVQFASSIAYTRDISSPQHHLAKMTSRPHFVSNSDIVKTAASFPNLSRKELVRKVRYQNLANTRQSFFSASQVQTTESSRKATRVRPTPSPYFTSYLNYDTDRQKVIYNFWEAKELSLEDAVRPLIKLSKPTAFQLHYPALAHSSEACKYCEKDLRKDRMPAVHVLKCGLKAMNIERTWIEQAPNIDYCFQCATTYNSDHDDKHLIELANSLALDSFCGIITRYGLVIRPGYCPFGVKQFHLTGTGCPYFLTAGELVKHIERHIKAISGESICCPHQVCQKQDWSVFASKTLFRAHLVNDHGIWKRGWPEDSVEVETMDLSR